MGGRVWIFSGTTQFPNTEKRVENIMFSGVFVTNFEVFGMW